MASILHSAFYLASAYVLLRLVSLSEANRGQRYFPDTGFACYHRARFLITPAIALRLFVMQWLDYP